MLRRSGCLLPGVLLLAACSGGADEPAPAPSGTASCAQVTAPGRPITAELLSRGCADRAGRAVRLTPYVCRGTGNLVVTYGRSVGGPLPLSLLDGVAASDAPTTTYGVWAAAKPGDPSDSTDAAGCEKAP